MKVLNLYAGIGGNRKLWKDVQVTAVEYNAEIAAIYQDHFTDDTVIVGDAHQYLLDHFSEYNFIWSSPPCPTHSNARFWSSKGGMYDVAYPDMTLYQEIILLKHFHTGKWVVENVKPYYDVLIPGKEIGRHLFWSNFNIPVFKSESNYIHNGSDRTRVEKMLCYDLSKYKIEDKVKILRNCVHPDIGLNILNRARNIIDSNNVEQQTLFATVKAHEVKP